MGKYKNDDPDRRFWTESKNFVLPDPYAFQWISVANQDPWIGKIRPDLFDKFTEVNKWEDKLELAFFRGGHAGFSRDHFPA